MELFRPETVPFEGKQVRFRARVYYVCGRSHFEDSVREEARAEIHEQFAAKMRALRGQAFYSASKFALEGYTEALSMEVEPFDILVSLIEPGFFKTHLHREMQRGALRSDDYATVREALETTLAVAIEQGDDPRKVAEIIVRIAGTKSSRLRYRVGNDSVWIPRLRALLSQNLFRRGMRRRFNIDKPASTRAA